MATLGSALIIFAVLLLAAKLLLARPAPFGALWPAAAPGAVAVAVLLSLAPPLLARFVSSSGAVYGSFATVAGLFAVLYLMSQALVYSAEIAAVRHAGLWPRALDQTRPTAADVRVQTLLAREQERMPAAGSTSVCPPERRPTCRRTPRSCQGLRPLIGASPHPEHPLAQASAGRRPRADGSSANVSARKRPASANDWRSARSSYATPGMAPSTACRCVKPCTAPP